ncbi:hypothetical protein Y1Q_0020938 [Alligator mississippiensis]|uniref:Uncharacterized protein n=1 Tax=Alligator mississippiensis TaxID=8496 RepID=A0A151NJG3_ALLMI|nr:hypothetical protein Y1Q_0020938 [Alligator mississippiensis]
MDWRSVLADNACQKSPRRHGASGKEPAEAPKEEWVGSGGECANNAINKLEIVPAGCRDSNNEGESEELTKTHDITGSPGAIGPIGPSPGTQQEAKAEGGKEPRHPSCSSSQSNRSSGASGTDELPREFSPVVLDLLGEEEKSCEVTEFSIFQDSDGFFSKF